MVASTYSIMQPIQFSSTRTNFGISIDAVDHAAGLGIDVHGWDWDGTAFQLEWLHVHVHGRASDDQWLHVPA
jgi:hypothetical protein